MSHFQLLEGLALHCLTTGHAFDWTRASVVGNGTTTETFDSLMHCLFEKNDSKLDQSKGLVGHVTDTIERNGSARSEKERHCYPNVSFTFYELPT